MLFFITSVIKSSAYLSDTHTCKRTQNKQTKTWVVLSSSMNCFLLSVVTDYFCRYKILSLVAEAIFGESRALNRFSDFSVWPEAI